MSFSSSCREVRGERSCGLMGELREGMDVCAGVRQSILVGEVI